MQVAGTGVLLGGEGDLHAAQARGGEVACRSGEEGGVFERRDGR